MSCRCPSGLLETPPRWHTTIYIVLQLLCTTLTISREVLQKKRIEHAPCDWIPDHKEKFNIRIHRMNSFRNLILHKIIAWFLNSDLFVIAAWHLWSAIFRDGPLTIWGSSGKSGKKKLICYLRGEKKLNSTTWKKKKLNSRLAGKRNSTRILCPSPPPDH